MYIFYGNIQNLIKRAHDLSLTQVNNYLASYIEYLDVKIKNNEMKNILLIVVTTGRGGVNRTVSSKKRSDGVKPV